MSFFIKNKKFFYLAGLFLSSFLIVFLFILLTQSAYSTPIERGLEFEGMQVIVGPRPNATNVPLDTTITIDALASASLDNLQLTPTVDFSGSASETTGPLTYKTIFYPKSPLQPAKNYEVNVMIMNTLISWSFTTTDVPFQPSLSYYLANNCLWIALIVAGSVTLLVGSIPWFRRKIA